MHASPRTPAANAPNSATAAHQAFLFEGLFIARSLTTEYNREDRGRQGLRATYSAVVGSSAAAAATDSDSRLNLVALAIAAAGSATLTKAALVLPTKSRATTR